MKLLSKFALLNLLCFTVFPAAAQDGSSSYTDQQISNNMSNLVEYFQNLGDYLGYNVTKSPMASNPNYTVSSTLLNMPLTQLTETYLFYTYLGAIPVNSFNGNALAQFIPDSVTGASTLNNLANNTFKEQNYNTASTQSSAQQVSVSPLIDQKEYQSDPVSQAVLNILGTPDNSYCMTSMDGGTWTSNCNLLYGALVPTNIIGPIPNATSFFNYQQYINQFLNQLNSNSLTAPLLYSIQNSDSSTSSPSSGNGVNPGLTAQNQAQLAANFIRYVSGAVTPINLPKWKDYDTLYNQATAPSNSNSVTPTQRLQAQATLSKYLASLRTYAAQNSVGLSNLYYIMSKRLPQNQKGSSGSATNPMSQALSEFNMATWRLFNSSSTNPGNTQWIEQINSASSATVEKEIAMLLAEINYQMYLDRQINERVLLTNSIILLQSTRTGQPSPDFTSQ